VIAATKESAKIFARDTSELLPCIELNVIELGSFRYALGYLRRIFTARLHNFWGSRPLSATRSSGYSTMAGWMATRRRSPKQSSERP
jgi:hypothetical protein